MSEGLKRQTGATQMSQIFIPLTTKTWEGADVGVGVQAPRGAPGGAPPNISARLAEP